MKGGIRIVLSSSVLVMALWMGLAREWTGERPSPSAPWVATTTTASPATEISPDIVGGFDAHPESFPWMAAILSSRYTSAYHGLRCGGTLIASDWVMTAAHCVLDAAGNRVRPDELAVLVGQYDLSATEGERLAVAAVVSHPDFNRATGEYDIALLHLAQSAAASVVPLSHIEPPALLAGEAEATVLGWGTTTWALGELGTYPALLQQAELPLVSSLQCQQAYRQRTGRPVEITENMMCAGSVTNLKDTCVGDSGGPLLHWDPETAGWLQSGIVSWGIGCAIPGYFGVYTNVNAFLPWIDAAIATSGSASGNGQTDPSRTLLPYIP